MTTVTRRGDTGKPGNAGKFDGQKRPDAEVLDLDKQARRTEVNQLLDGSRNGHSDPIAWETREAIADYAVNGGNTEAWAGVYSKNLRRNTTLWQAVLAHSDYNVRHGPTTAVADPGFPPFRPAVIEQTSDWEAVPSADQILAGLRGIKSEDRPGVEHTWAGDYVTHDDGRIGFIPADADSEGWEE